MRMFPLLRKRNGNGVLGPLMMPGVSRRIGGFEIFMPPLTLAPGEILGVFGHSGSGKSTYLRAVHEQLGFASATLMHQGEPLVEQLSALQNIELGALAAGFSAEQGNALIDALLDPLGLRDLLPRRVTSLSGGQRRRVYLAQILSTDPDLLLLDEPFTGLGWKYEGAVRGLILERQLRCKPTIVVSHDLEFLSQFATRILLVNEGQHAGWVHPAEPHLIEVEDLWARTVGVTNIVEVSKLEEVFIFSEAARKAFQDAGNSIGFWRSWIWDTHSQSESTRILLTLRPNVRMDCKLTFSHGESLGLLRYQMNAGPTLELQVSATEKANFSQLWLVKFIRIK